MAPLFLGQLRLYKVYCGNIKYRFMDCVYHNKRFDCDPISYKIEMCFVELFMNIVTLYHIKIEMCFVELYMNKCFKNL